MRVRVIIGVAAKPRLLRFTDFDTLQEDTLQEKDTFVARLDDERVGVP